MPKDDPSSSDPMQIVGVEVSADGVDAVREMAACYAAEMAWLGYGREKLMRLFKDPFYSAPHGALKQLGEAEIESIVTAICADVVDNGCDRAAEWEV